MILVDANILLYAEDTLSEQHEAARKWWDQQLSASEPVCFCWAVLTAFIRISTNARLYRRPLTLKEAVERIQSWLDQPCTRILVSTEKHWDVLQVLLRQGNATANLVSDAHVAALAVEHNCVLYSTDTDFARFPGVKWKNPIKLS